MGQAWMVFMEFYIWRGIDRREVTRLVSVLELAQYQPHTRKIWVWIWYSYARLPT